MAKEPRIYDWTKSVDTSTANVSRVGYAFVLVWLALVGLLVARTIYVAVIKHL